LGIVGDGYSCSVGLFDELRANANFEEEDEEESQPQHPGNN
jgi:hypothetical protein